MANPAEVLVVDDDPDIREFMTYGLRDAGYRVRSAGDGAAALELVRHGRPDLILLDLRLPVMDGRAFLRAYRALPPPHAPVVLVTAELYAAQRAAELGADGFLAKPFGLRELVSTVRHHLGR